MTNPAHAVGLEAEPARPVLVHSPGPANPSLFSTLHADYEAALALDPLKPRSLRRTFDVLTLPGFLAVVIFRLAQRARAYHLVPIARLLYLMNVVLFGASMHPSAKVGPGLVVVHPMALGFAAGCVLGRNATLGGGVILGTGGFDDPTKDGFPVIGDDCHLHNHSMVLGPLHVGNGVIVGVNSVVTKNVPDGAVMVGYPARLVRYRPGYGPQADSASAETG